MATKTQLDTTYKKLKDFRTKYIKKKYLELDESATRIMINSFFTEVLGYIELEDIKTEYRIRGEYADYVIQLNRKKRMVVEVKAIQIDLDEKHLRQSLTYAANEGIDWIMLTNGRNFKLYRVIFSKPIETVLVMDLDMTDLKDIKNKVETVYLLSKRAMLKDELEVHWHRFNALALENLTKYLYSEDVVKVLKKLLKKDVGFNFNEEDLLNSIEELINTQHDSKRPKVPYKNK